jgi:hypothetical protein
MYFIDNVCLVCIAYQLGTSRTLRAERLRRQAPSSAGRGPLFGYGVVPVDSVRDAEGLAGRWDGWWLDEPRAPA